MWKTLRVSHIPTATTAATKHAYAHAGKEEKEEKEEKEKDVMKVKKTKKKTFLSG